MKIDTHQHFWKYSANEYPWIGDDMSSIARDRLPSDLRPLVQKMGIAGTIAVQARQCLEENNALLKMAQDSGFVRGVVGWVDLRSPRVDEQLEKYASNPLFVGVRHVVQDEPDENFVLQKSFLAGISRLVDYKLVYDILIYPNQLPAAIKLVAKFPNQPFVLDHIAKPYIKNKKISPWDEFIRELASNENVSCKISGMVTEADWQNWRFEDFEPYLNVVWGAFGANRLMIGSDWPVCTLAGDYENVLGIAVNFISKFSESEQTIIWEKNPVRIYNLK